MSDSNATSPEPGDQTAGQPAGQGTHAPRTAKTTPVIPRTLQLINLLQSGLTYTPDQLASELAVTRRTVFRYIRRLEDAGIEIRFDPQRSSYQLGAHYAKSMPLLDNRELAALFLAVKTSPLMADPVLAPLAGAAMARILATMPAIMQQSINRILTACQSAPVAFAMDGQILQALAAAISAGRQVRLKITQPMEQGPEVTLFAPYRLVVEGQRWFVFGRSSLHGGRRAFDLSQIEEAELTHEVFKIPAFKEESVEKAVAELKAEAVRTAGPHAELRKSSYRVDLRGD